MSEQIIRTGDATVVYRDGQPHVGAFLSSASKTWRVSDRRSDAHLGTYDNRGDAEKRIDLAR